VVFLDPEALNEIETSWITEPDPAVAEAVLKARERLPRGLDLLVYQRFYQGMTIPDIARANSLSPIEVRAGLYEALRLLRHYLADFAFKRWGVMAAVCRICTHPRMAEIDRMLESKARDESWGAFIKRLEDVIGQRIYPPNILIVHDKHKSRSRVEGDGYGGR
jgi:hypothetical protein